MQGNILIIEDIKELSDLIALYLSRDGFEVRAAESAEEGFAVIEAWKPELVILDINLPGMDGFEFLQRYRKSSETPVREQLVEIKAAAFLQNLVGTLGMDIDLLHHEFISDINLPETLFIPMNERLVQRALENLISNAIRHTPHGSTIRFTAAMNKNAVVLTISDNGPGIDKEALPHVFEMFYRSSPSRREQGMGLGLAVVKWVVDYHGWSISVSPEAESAEKNKGTSFTITIPFNVL